MKKSKKNKKTNWLIGGLSALLIGFSAYAYYDYMSSYEKGVIPMFGDNFTYNEMTFDASQGFEFHGSNGTHLSIPKLAFIDKDGKTVNGKVKVKFREFHDAKSILLSGIPMQMNENRNEYMQSAGMMELRAYKDGNELSMKNRKSIKVNLAALNKVDENFNLYFLDNDEQWIETGKFQTDSNQFKIDSLAAIPSLPIFPKNPNPDSSDFVFTLSMDLKNAPYLRSFKGVDWVMVKKNGEGNPHNELRTGWDRIKVKRTNKKENIFKISFFREVKRPGSEKHKNEKFSLNAIPALKGKELAKALEDYKSDLKKYETLLALKELEEERLAMESDLVNTFEIGALGFWNCDRLQNTEILANGTYAFDFEDQFLSFVNKVKLYIVLNDQNGVLTYYNFNWSDMPFFINEDVEIFAVLPDLTVAYVSAQEYNKKVNKKTVSKLFTNRVKFSSQIMPKEKAFAYIENLRTNNSKTELANNNQ